MHSPLQPLHWLCSQQSFSTNSAEGFSSVHVRHGIKVDAAPPAESSCVLLVPLVGIASGGRAKGGHLLGHSREFGEITLWCCARFTKKCVMASACSPARSTWGALRRCCYHRHPRDFASGLESTPSERGSVSGPCLVILDSFWVKGWDRTNFG